MTTPEILIVGGTGKIGGELLSLLINSKTNCRVIVRPNSKAILPNSEFIEKVIADLENPASLDAAFEGIKQVFLLTRDQKKQGELESNFINLAKSNGVEKIVKSSAFAAGLEPPVGYGLTHCISEQSLINSGLKWVILRPYMFMQNFIELSDLIISRGVVPLPMGNAKIGLIDARDVSLVAHAILHTEKFDNKTYVLTGPESISLSESARTLSEITGKPLKYRSPPFWLAGLMMRIQGTSSWDVAMRKGLFKMIKAGGEEEITNHVEKITNTKPRNLEVFVRDHLNSFQSAE
jgi:uncharacterized protein YbjT (DUF2867 family)